MISGVTDSASLLHAYLCTGTRDNSMRMLIEFLEQLGISSRCNPDFHVFEADLLTIEHARRIKAQAAKRAVGAAPKMFLITCHGATREAQNALLKLLEEPGERTHFFIIVESAHALLPTLRSRLAHVVIPQQARSDATAARAFLAATPAERLEMVSSIIESKDRARAAAFLRDVLAVRYEHVPVEALEPANRDALRELATLESYLADRSASVKLILEHAALRL